MSLVIPDDVLQSAHMSEEEFKREVAVMLFEKERLTLGRASQLADMNQIAFQHLLASRQIPVHYDTADLEEDLETLKGTHSQEQMEA